MLTLQSPLSLIMHRNALLYSQIYIFYWKDHSIYIYIYLKTYGFYFTYLFFLAIIENYDSPREINPKMDHFEKKIYLLYKNTHKERKLITEQLSLFVSQATNDWSRAIDRQSRKQKRTSRLTCRSLRRFSIVIGKYVAQRALLPSLDE